MEVILLHDVNGLGRAGDEREVADGYARNFLFPKHLAVPDTAVVREERAELAESERRAAERQLRECQRLAEQLDGFVVTVVAKANEEGTLYGSIAAAHIVEALRRKGFAVEPTWIALEQPIRLLGEFPVALRFPEGLEGEMTVIVEAEE